MSEAAAMREGATRPVMNREEVEAFLAREFPEIYLDGPIWHVEAVGPMTARMRLDFHPRHIRPGGTLSGPAMMTLADLALYVAVLANVGPVALAVTTNLSFNFLRKPPQAALVADTRLLKLGRRLAVGEVTIVSEGGGEAVCHATGTYALPG
ncbi:MAG: PaaI family thioesterase [Salinarimonas sp.]